jgi:hypothetical protein
MPLKNDEKLLLKEILYNSLCQAVIRLVQSPHLPLKLFLFIFIGLSNVLAAYYIIGSILSFLSFEVVTTTRTIYETPTLFPKITICNRNRFQTEFTLEFLKELNKKINPNASLFNIEQMLNFNSSFKTDLMEKVITKANGIIKNDFTDYQRKQLGLDINDILMSCKFDANLCSPRDFKWVYDSYYGNCYEFNWDNIKSSSVSGAINGLRLRLFVDFHENLTLINSYIGGSGCVLKIGNSTYLIDHKLNAVQIQSGMYTNLDITRSFKFMLPKPFSNCVLELENKKRFNSTFFNLITNSGYLYTQELCITQCYQYIVIKECSCSDSLLLSLYDTKYCETDEEIKCSLNLSAINVLSDSYRYCLNACPLECYHIEYKTTLTSVNLIGDYFVDFIKENVNLSRNFLQRKVNANTAHKSIVRLNIYYDSLAYVDSRESAKVDIFSLIGFVGGILGLFLGINVFSFFELFEAFVQIYLLRYKKTTLYPDLS